jgi:hypothetical protein
MEIADVGGNCCTNSFFLETDEEGHICGVE